MLTNNSQSLDFLFFSLMQQKISSVTKLCSLVYTAGSVGVYFLGSYVD